MKNEPASVDPASILKPAVWVRIARRLLFAAAVLATLVALLYAEENWRGARAWAECKRWLESRGESLDPASIIPPPIPDDKNFAMTPLLLALIESRQKNQGSSASAKTAAVSAVLPIDVSDYVRSIPNRLEDVDSLAASQKYFRDSGAFSLPATPQEPARDVFDALNKFAPELDELERAAAERPLARFPLAYDAQPSYLMRLSHVIVISRCVEVLGLRAKAALTLGNMDRSKRDILLSLRLSESLANEPILLSQLVRAVSVNSPVRVIREGMAARRWSADDLTAFSQALQRIDLLQGFMTAMRGERLLFINPTLDYLKTHGGKTMQELSEVTGSHALATGWGMPKGWFDQNKVAVNIYNQTYHLEAIDLKTRRMDLERLKAGRKFIQESAWSPYKFFLRQAGGYSDFHGQEIAAKQASIDQARVACGLERYSLDKKEYPASADALVPAYLEQLPTGVIDGKPIGYRRTDDGRYLLSFTARSHRDGNSGDDWTWKYQADPKK